MQTLTHTHKEWHQMRSYVRRWMCLYVMARSILPKAAHRELAVPSGCVHFVDPTRGPCDGVSELRTHTQTHTLTTRVLDGISRSDCITINKAIVRQIL